MLLYSALVLAILANGYDAKSLRKANTTPIRVTKPTPNALNTGELAKLIHKINQDAGEDSKEDNHSDNHIRNPYGDQQDLDYSGIKEAREEVPLSNIVKLLQKNYDAKNGNVANSADEVRTHYIKNPAVLEQYKEDMRKRHHSTSSSSDDSDSSDYNLKIERLLRRNAVFRLGKSSFDDDKKAALRNGDTRLKKNSGEHDKIIHFEPNDYVDKLTIAFKDNKKSNYDSKNPRDLETPNKNKEKYEADTKKDAWDIITKNYNEWGDKGDNKKASHKYNDDDKYNKNDKYNNDHKTDDKYNDGYKKKVSNDDEYKKRDAYNDNYKNNGRHDDGYIKNDKFKDDYKNKDKYNDDYKKKDYKDDYKKNYRYRDEFQRKDDYKSNDKYKDDYKKKDYKDDYNKGDRYKDEFKNDDRQNDDYKKHDKYKDDYAKSWNDKEMSKTEFKKETNRGDSEKKMDWDRPENSKLSKDNSWDSWKSKSMEKSDKTKQNKAEEWDTPQKKETAALGSFEKQSQNDWETKDKFKEKPRNTEDVYRNEENKKQFVPQISDYYHSRPRIHDNIERVAFKAFGRTSIPFVGKKGIYEDK